MANDGEASCSESCSRSSHKINLGKDKPTGLHRYRILMPLGCSCTIPPIPENDRQSAAAIRGRRCCLTPKQQADLEYAEEQHDTWELGYHQG